MNLKQLPYFQAIASLGSLSAASERIGISQPALSKYLISLESNIGLKLFETRKKRLILTEAGKIYLDGIQEIMRIQARNKNSIASLSGIHTKELHIGISPHRGAKLFAKLFTSFEKRYPEISLIPHEGYSITLNELLIKGDISLAITGLDEKYSFELEKYVFSKEELTIAVQDYHPIVKKHPYNSTVEPLDISEFYKSVFVMPEKPASAYYAVMDFFKKHGFSPIIVASSPNITLMDALINDGAGIGFVTKYYMKENGNIKYYHLQDPPHIESSFIKRKDHIFSEAERFFIFLALKEQLKNKDTDTLFTKETIAIFNEFNKDDTICEL